MIHGVAQQMGQGRLQPLENVAIDLRVLTQNLKLHFLAQRAGQITHHARKPADPIAKRAHAGAEHFQIKPMRQVSRTPIE